LPPQPPLVAQDTLAAQPPLAAPASSCRPSLLFSPKTRLPPQPPLAAPASSCRPRHACRPSLLWPPKTRFPPQPPAPAPAPVPTSPQSWLITCVVRLQWGFLTVSTGPDSQRQSGDLAVSTGRLPNRQSSRLPTLHYLPDPAIQHSARCYQACSLYGAINPAVSTVLSTLQSLRCCRQSLQIPDSLYGNHDSLFISDRHTAGHLAVSTGSFSLYGSPALLCPPALPCPALPEACQSAVTCTGSSHDARLGNANRSSLRSSATAVSVGLLDCIRIIRVISIY
jgi:hypothetical protein